MIYNKKSNIFSRESKGGQSACRSGHTAPVCRLLPVRAARWHVSTVPKFGRIKRSPWDRPLATGSVKRVISVISNIRAKRPFRSSCGTPCGGDTHLLTRHAFMLGEWRHRDVSPSAIRPTRGCTTPADPRICASGVRTKIKSIRMSYLIAMLIRSIRLEITTEPGRSRLRMSLLVRRDQSAQGALPRGLPPRPSRYLHIC